MRTVTIGVDLSKQVFSVCSVDAAGQIRERKDLRREAFALWPVQVPAGTVVAMEACDGAHHWARHCLEYGLQPRLMAAQFVTPFRKSRTAKNDRNDAEAIATTARQGNMRFVPVKTIEQTSGRRRRTHSGARQGRFALRPRPRHYRHRCHYRRYAGGQRRFGARVQERSAAGRVAWPDADPALQWWQGAAG
jgi:transposase